MTSLETGRKKKNDYLIYSQKTVNLSHQSKPISDIIMDTFFHLSLLSGGKVILFMGHIGYKNIFFIRNQLSPLLAYVVIDQQNK